MTQVSDPLRDLIASRFQAAPAQPAQGDDPLKALIAERFQGGTATAEAPGTQTAPHDEPGATFSQPPAPVFYGQGGTSPVPVPGEGMTTDPRGPARARNKAAVDAAMAQEAARQAAEHAKNRGVLGTVADTAQTALAQGVAGTEAGWKNLAKGLTDPNETIGGYLTGSMSSPVHAEDANAALGLTGTSSQDLEGMGQVAAAEGQQHPAAGFVGRQYAMLPGLADPKALAAMIISKNPTSLVMDSAAVQGTLQAIGQKFGPAVMRATEAELHGVVGVGNFSATQTALEGGSRGEVLASGAKGAAAGALLGIPGAIMGGAKGSAAAKAASDAAQEASNRASFADVAEGHSARLAEDQRAREAQQPPQTAQEPAPVFHVEQSAPEAPKAAEAPVESSPQSEPAAPDYSTLPRRELVLEAGRRGVPRNGTAEELRARLAEDDAKAPEVIAPENTETTPNSIDNVPETKDVTARPDYTTMDRGQLVREARRQNLPAGGSAEELRARLTDATEAQGRAAAPATSRKTASLRINAPPIESDGVVTHDVTAIDKAGSEIVDIQFTVKDGHASVESVLLPKGERSSSSKGVSGIEDDAGKMGTTTLLGVMRELRKSYPEIKTVSGERVSGAQAASRLDTSLADWKSRGIGSKSSAEKPTPSEAKGSPRQYTSIDRAWIGEKLFAWTHDQQITLKKGQKLPGVNKSGKNAPMRSMPMQWRDQLGKVPTDATRLLDHIRGKTDEVWDLEGKAGRRTTLAPRQLIDEAKAAVPDWEDDVTAAKAKRKARMDLIDSNRAKKAGDLMAKADAKEIEHARGMSPDDWDELSKQNPYYAENLATMLEKADKDRPVPEFDTDELDTIAEHSKGAEGSDPLPGGSGGAQGEGGSGGGGAVGEEAPSWKDRLGLKDEEPAPKEVKGNVFGEDAVEPLVLRGQDFTSNVKSAGKINESDTPTLGFGKPEAPKAKAPLEKYRVGDRFNIDGAKVSWAGKYAGRWEVTDLEDLGEHGQIVTVKKVNGNRKTQFSTEHLKDFGVEAPKSETRREAERKGMSIDEAQERYPGIKSSESVADYEKRMGTTDTKGMFEVGYGGGKRKAPVIDDILGKADKADAKAKTPISQPDRVPKLLRGIVETGRTLQKIFAPTTAGPEAVEAHAAMREMWGRLDREKGVILQKVREAAQAFDKNSNDANLKIIDDLETGKPSADPVVRRWADARNAVYDQLIKEVRGVDPNALQALIENYFPHVWEKPEKAIGVMQQIMAKRPVEGGKSFLKKRSIPTIAEGVAAGLKPVSYNPIELDLMKMMEMKKFVLARRLLIDGKQSGQVKFIPSEQQVPDGWRAPDDRMFTVYGPPIERIPEYVDKAVYEGLNKFSDAIGVEHSRKAKIGGTRLGYSVQGGSKVVTKFATELSVLAHEIGHQIDHKYGLWDELTGGGKSAGSKKGFPQDELRAIADLAGPRGAKGYTRNKFEKIAQMVEMYVHAPEQMKGAAPRLYTWFDNYLKARPELAPLRDVKPGIALDNLGSEHYVGLRIMGKYAMPESAANIINQHLSPGLRQHAWFRGLLGGTNILNQATLGISGFHATFETVNATTGQLAHAVQRLAAGEPMDAAWQTAKVPTAVVHDIAQGGKLLQALYEPGKMGPEVEKVLDAMVSGGARGKQDPFYSNQVTKNMMKAFREGGMLGNIEGAARSPFAAIEQLARPTFEYLVPRLKIASGFQMAEAKLKSMGPDATPAQIRVEMGKVWDSVENRHGQMAYENLAMNKVAKDLMMATVGRPGWQIGTVRELAGGAFDLAKAGAKSLMGKEAELGPRAAYLVALPIVVGTVGALINRGMTGEWPKELRDYFMPRTGGTGMDGKPERVMLPSYMKDAMHITQNPGAWAKSKVNPMLSMVWSMMDNKDFFGTEIRSPEDSILGQLRDTGAFAAKGLIPYSVSNMQKSMEQGDSAGHAALSFVGINSPPKDLTATRAERMMNEILAGQRGTAAKTKEQGERAQARAAFVKGAKTGDQDAKDEAKQGMTRSDLKAAQKTIVRGTFRTRFETITDVHQAVHVFEAGTTEERKQVFSDLWGRVARSQTLTPQEKQQIRGTLDPYRPSKAGG